MSQKPDKVPLWAAQDAIAQIGAATGDNKIEPSESLKQFGTLDGILALNYLNHQFFYNGEWAKFMNEFVEVATGQGLNLTKDDHFSLIFAFDTTIIGNRILGYANKVSTNPAVIDTLLSNVLFFGAPQANGTVEILGGIDTNIRAFSLNFKL